MAATATIASLLDTEPASSGLTDVQRTAGLEQCASIAPDVVPERRLRMRVVWGDLTRTAGDVHVVGHYQGVLPGTSERAVDRAISPKREVIADHTRRRWLVGELGAITYFPGVDARAYGEVAVRRVAVVGMGRLGTFSEARATRLYSSLLRELGALPDVSTAAGVLIGSGARNLGIGDAARALMRGIQTVLSSAADDFRMDDLALVEQDRLRAEQLLAALSGLRTTAPLVDLVPELEQGPGGVVGADAAAVYALRALSATVRREGAEPGSHPLSGVLGQLGDTLPAELCGMVRDQLASIPDDIGRLTVAVSNPATEVAGDGTPDQIDAGPPTRISVSYDQDRIRWAALTARATVPERSVPAEPKLIGELVQRLTAPNSDDAAQLPRLLRRLVVPEDLQPHITARGSVPIVLEVDPEAAELPWEFLTDREYDEGQVAEPLALRTPIARQLRTSYARVAADLDDSAGLRALVIADPGPVGLQLPRAREEGIAVWELMRRRGVDATLFVGSAESPEKPPPPGARFATKLDVLNELLAGRYDLVHFAGHGTMDPEHPERAGWVFAGGDVTARTLAQPAWAPRLVMANACWSAAGLGKPGAEAPIGVGAPERQAQSRLTTVLADEFLRVGVSHYIGTSWRMPDGTGSDFALEFYERILPANGHRGEPVGRALCAARAKVWRDRRQDAAVQAVPEPAPEVLCAWAAYQHYGDPADALEPSGATVPATATNRGGQ